VTKIQRLQDRETKMLSQSDAETNSVRLLVRTR